jgi:hypothetical protein
MTPAASHTPTRAHPAVVISPRRAARFFSAAVLVLVALHASKVAIRVLFHHDSLFGLLEFVDLDEERSFPTWYSGGALLTAAALMAVITGVKRRQRDAFAVHWCGLAGVLTAMSADEILMFHECLVPLVARVIPAEGYLRQGWVVVALPLVGALLLTYASFLRALPARFRWLMVGSGVVFVAGAIGAEVVGSVVYEATWTRTVAYDFWVIMEEGMEMAGVVLLIYTLVSYIGSCLPGLTIGFAEPGVEAPPNAPRRMRATPSRAPAYTPSHARPTPRGVSRLPVRQLTPSSTSRYERRLTPSGQ